jgi:hypothetical protein
MYLIEIVNKHTKIEGLERDIARFRSELKTSKDNKVRSPIDDLLKRGCSHCLSIRIDFRVQEKLQLNLIQYESQIKLLKKRTKELEETNEQYRNRKESHERMVPAAVELSQINVSYTRMRLKSNTKVIVSFFTRICLLRRC